MKIQIYSMGSWGELGNRLAAETLGDLIREAFPTAHVAADNIENSCPTFAAIGQRILALTLDSTDASQRSLRYVKLMEEVAKTYFPSEFDLGLLPESISEDVRRLRDILASTTPDLVIGTKGVISRTLAAARRDVECPIPVVNHVTNGGLLALGLHRSKYLALHLVPFETDRRTLIDTHGYDPDQVAVIGPLVAGTRLAAALIDDKVSDVAPPAEADIGQEARQCLLVFANRDGRQYLSLLEALGRDFPDSTVIFVGLNDPKAVAGAAAIAVHCGATNWKQYLKLPQDEFLRAVRLISSTPHGFMICKPGPNTVLEAIHMGIPCVILDSGLPMERWVCDWIRKEEIGAVCADTVSLKATVSELCREPARVVYYKERVRRLRIQLFDRDRSRRALACALGRTMADGPTRARSTSGEPIAPWEA